MSESSFAVDNIGSAERDTLILTFSNQRAVRASDGLSYVGHHGNVHLTETTLSSGLLGVLHVGEVGVDGTSDDLGSDLLELSSSIAEITNLSGAHKSEIKGPEEQHGVLS